MVSIQNPHNLLQIKRIQNETPHLGLLTDSHRFTQPT